MTIPPAYIKEKMKNVSRERNQETAIDEKKARGVNQNGGFSRKLDFPAFFFFNKKTSHYM